MNADIIKYALTALEIELQGVQNLKNNFDDNFAETVKTLLNCKGRFVISGIGKSGIIAQKMVATFNSTGSPAIFMHASDAIHGDLGMIQNEDIVIILSKSGESPEVKVLVPLVKKLEAKIVAITGNTQSYLGKNADYTLNTYVEREACPNNIAPTSSTTAQLVMGDILAVCLIKLKHFSKNDFAKYHPGGDIGKQLFLTVEDLYKNNSTPSVTHDTPLKYVILTITKGRVGATAVIDEQKKVTGIITDGDIRRLLEKTDSLGNIIAKDITSANPKTVNANTLALDAMEILKSYNVNQLLVTDEENTYLGIVHLHDLIREGFS